MGFNLAARALALALTVIALPGLALAQPSPTAPRANVDAEALKAARDLLAATDADKQFTAMVPMVFRQFRDAFPAQPPGRQQEADKVFDEVEKQFLARSDEAIDLIAHIYAGKFTKEEMNALADFYRSPVGRKFVEKTPEIMAESLKLGNAWGQRLAREVEQTIIQELQRRGLKL